MIEQKRKTRKPLTLGDKINIIRRKESEFKLSDNDLAKEYDVDRSTISSILRNKDKILQTYMNATPSVINKTRMQTGKFPALEEALYKWFLGIRSQNIPVSQEMLRVKALHFYNEARNKGVYFSNFEASQGWLENFQERYNISSKHIHGESESADLEQVNKGRESLQELLIGHDLNDIYNADETGLFFRLGPDQTLATKSDNAKGFKKDKERITVLLCCNASGTRKVLPFVLGKAKKPHCFKNINMNNLPVKYSSNKKAWMTMEKWNEWLKWFDQTLNKKSVLLVDNCPSHTNGSQLGLRFLQIVFLPPNTTSHIQPCDAGIIRNFKANYRNVLVQKMIQNLDVGKEIKKINIKEAIDMLSDAWDSVKQETIVNYWKHTNILPLTNIPPQITMDDDTVITELESSLKTLSTSTSITMKVEEYIKIDDNLTTSELLTDDDILEGILLAEGITNPSQTSIEEDTSNEEEEPKISHQDGKKSIEIAKKFLEQSDFATREDIKYINNIIKRLNVSTDRKKRQSSITEFY